MTQERRRSSLKQGQFGPKTSLTYRDEMKPRKSAGLLELHERLLQRTPLSPSLEGAEHLLKEDQVSASAAAVASGLTLDPKSWEDPEKGSSTVRPE